MHTHTPLTCARLKPVKENMPIWAVMKLQLRSGMRFSSAARSSLRTFFWGGVGVIVVVVGGATALGK
jgi:hypothetical protein